MPFVSFDEDIRKRSIESVHQRLARVHSKRVPKNRREDKERALESSIGLIKRKHPSQHNIQKLLEPQKVHKQNPARQDQQTVDIPKAV